MCRAQWVLAVVALSIGVAHSWDLAVSLGDELMFYTDDGTKTDTVNLKSRILGSLAYDEVHNMMLYVDKKNKNDTICGYNLSSKENVCYTLRNGRNIHSIAYDPVTEKLFFTDTNEKSINWISLKSGSNNNISETLVIKMHDRTPTDIAVESCGGYIYWSNIGMFVPNIERICFNGSGKQDINYDVDIDGVSFTIDPRARKIYYFESVFHVLKSINFTGDNLFNEADIYSEAKDLTVSKGNIYWMSSSEGYKSVWQYPMNATNSILFEPKEIKFYTNKSLSIAANYKMLDQIKEIHGCESLSTIQAAAPANTGGQCDVPVCANYCLQGNCTVNDEGLPECSCNAGYSGERCEVFMCQYYCLNDGDCSLNEKDQPVCQCVGNYEGPRCEVDKNNTCTIINTPTFYSEQKNLTLAGLLSNWRKRTARISVTVEV